MGTTGGAEGAVAHNCGRLEAALPLVFRWLRRKALIRKKRDRERIACLCYRYTSDEQKNTPTHCNML